MANCESKNFLSILLIYLRLGCISFGGPVAHIGYFRDAFVQKRKWVSEGEYVELIALCHSVPGPSSSQLGFALGWLRGGFSGGIAAWLGFTLPSALLMMAAAYGLLSLGEQTEPLIGGLLTAAVAVVAHAALGLARKMCPDRSRVLLATACGLIAHSLSGNLAQLLAVALGVGVGFCCFRKQHATANPGAKLGRRIHPGFIRPSLFLFMLLLGAAILWPVQAPGALYAKHYEAGALVFGGGHVVLPLLADSVVATGLLSNSDFLAGYSAAQAVPGPLFTLAAFNGTVSGAGWAGGLLTLGAIFLPGLLLIGALLPSWDRFRSNPWARSGLTGANAAVVGLLFAALVDPVWSEGIHSGADLTLAGLAFIALQTGKIPVWCVVFGCGIAGLLFI